MSDGNSLAETRLQLALDAGAVGTWTSDLTTGRQVWDDRQRKLLGIGPEEDSTRAAFLSLVLPEDRPRIAWRDEDLRPGARHVSQFRIRRRDGVLRWIAASAVVRHDADGNPIELVGINWDITEQKDAEGQLLEAERRLSLATQAAEIGIWDWNVATGEFFYSDRARQIYGFGPDEAITYDRLRERTHPEDFKQVEPALARALDPAERAHVAYRYRITRADTGQERWLLAHGAALFSGPDRAATPLRYTGTLQDITNEVAVEDVLRDERARLELALSAADLALWELDAVTGIVKHSPALNRLYGFAEDAQPTFEALSSRYAPGENDRLQREAAEAIGRGEPSIRVEAKLALPDGTAKWVAIRARIFNSDEGTPRRVVGVALDVTERKRWEETLLITAAELQHRVKNTLAVVQSLARQSFGHSATDTRTREFFDRLRSLATATDLITLGNWATVSLRNLVEAAIAPFNEGRRIVVEGRDEPEVASRDVTSLSLCLHELCTNAAKYGALSNQTGHIRISWETAPGQILISWQEEGGPPVVPPTRRGFGSKLLTSAVFDGGAVDLAFLPPGLIATIRLAKR